MVDIGGQGDMKNFLPKNNVELIYLGGINLHISLVYSRRKKILDFIFPWEYRPCHHAINIWL